MIFSAVHLTGTTYVTAGAWVPASFLTALSSALTCHHHGDDDQADSGNQKNNLTVYLSSIFLRFFFLRFSALFFPISIPIVYSGRINVIPANLNVRVWDAVTSVHIKSSWDWYREREGEERNSSTWKNYSHDFIKSWSNFLISND